MSPRHSYTEHFIACNKHDIAHFKPFIIKDHIYGYVTPLVCNLLLQKTSSFLLTDQGLALLPHLDSFQTRSDALAEAVSCLTVHFGKELRHEMYPVIENWGDEPMAQIDRVAVAWFGIRAWGIHVNGFVRKADGLCMWIGERALDRIADPGKLDNMIGGGQPIRLSLEENLCKEAEEEAGLDALTALKALQVQAISYTFENSQGLRRDTIFAYDLELPENIIPHNTDGEVAAFHLMPIKEVAELVYRSEKIKYNCNLVIIDFLMRHGFITPEHEEYKNLVTWLHL